jgi:hypothetical protein
VKRAVLFISAFVFGAVLFAALPAAAETAAAPGATTVSEPSGLPPGVKADQWLALSPTAGVKLSAPTREDAPIVGTLYIFNSGAWRPVYLESPRRAPSAVPASRFHGARGPMYH